MKKLFAFVLTVLLVLPFSACGNDSLKANPLSEFLYIINDNGQALIKEYIGDSKTVIIPEEIDGNPVMAIQIGAFTRKNVEKVVMPSQMLNIQPMAFSFCYDLEEVIFNDSLSYMQDRAFYRCTALEEIRLPEGLTFLGENAFMYCRSLKKVYITKNIDTWYGSVFYGCPLTSVIFENGIKKIGSYASFCPISKLKNVVIPPSVDTIVDYSFNSGLESVTFLGDVPQDVDFPFDENTIIYYRKNASGWEDTPLREKYTLIEFNLF